MTIYTTSSVKIRGEKASGMVCGWESVKDMYKNTESLYNPKNLGDESKYISAFDIPFSWVPLIFSTNRKYKIQTI